MKPPRTIEDIAAALRGKPTIEECGQLTQACEPLRVERRARLKEVCPTYPGLSISKQPAAYREAYLAGPMVLKQEQERLQSELEYIDALEAMCSEAREAALNERARAEIPKAVKRLPRHLDAVRAALAQLEAAIATANLEMEIIGEFERLADKKNPLGDSQLAEILELRNKLWQPLNLYAPNNISPDPEAATKYPKSWPLLYKQDGVNGPTITTRRPPKDINPFDYSSDPVVRVADAGK